MALIDESEACVASYGAGPALVNAYSPANFGPTPYDHASKGEKTLLPSRGWQPYGGLRAGQRPPLDR